MQAIVHLWRADWRRGRAGIVEAVPHDGAAIDHDQLAGLHLRPVAFIEFGRGDHNRRPEGISRVIILDPDGNRIERLEIVRRQHARIVKLLWGLAPLEAADRMTVRQIHVGAAILVEGLEPGQDFMRIDF